MELYKILEGVSYDGEKLDNVDVKGIAIDSREVKQGDVFIAMHGDRLNGNDYIGEAIENGAVAIVTDVDVVSPHVKVHNIRQAYAIMSANFFGNPSKNLNIIAVVGTNGKSTTAYFVYEILRHNGYKVGLIGTGKVRYGEREIYQEMTTPDPHLLHGYLREMLDAGIEYVVMEVSAHAIYLEKMYGIKCDIGLFTNLSQDHLDFFHSMDIYKRVKLSYFNSRYMKVGIVNSDDECSRDIISGADMPTFTYGMDNPSDVFAIDLEYCVNGTRFVVNMLDEISRFATELVGRYNVYNILGAALVTRLIGVPMYGIRDAVEVTHAPAGRYNIIHTPRADFVIDYAHTPTAMENVISETRRVNNGKIYVVFGCGGDRDKSKRPQMGAIATKLADKVILTSDNTRGELIADIIRDIEKGIDGEVTVIENRYEAIKRAYELSDKGDIVLVLGKGAEKYQYNGIESIYYSDREAILDISKRG